MKTFKFSFHGRQTGAIGITYDINQEYKADSLEEATTMLFKDYEAFRHLEVNGKPLKDLKKEHFEHPIIKTYKGLGMKRK